MDTGTNAASIQSCDVAASLLFRIATAVFEGMRRCQAEPESRQTGWGVWLSVRKLAGNVAQERTFPPSGLTLKEFATLLEAAHLYAATGACRYGAQQTNGRARHHGLCECPTAELCRTVIALIFTPGSAELLNSVVNEGGRGQSPEQCAELPGPCICVPGCSVNGECTVHGDAGHLPGKLVRFLDGEAARPRPTPAAKARKALRGPSSISSPRMMFTSNRS